MPEYPWLFDGAPDKPNDRGLALITYVQWLGSWLESYPYYEDLCADYSTASRESAGGPLGRTTCLQWLLPVRQLEIYHESNAAAIALGGCRC